MGPTYCETPSMVVGFPVEPVNAWSNLFIIAIGLVTIVLVVRRPIREGSKGLWMLALLLTLTGLGSFLWHGWRTSAFLVLDALPGALFLLTAAYRWLRRFYSGWSTFFIFCGFLALIAASVFVGTSVFRNNLIMVSITPPILMLGAWLVARTYQESLRAAALGGGALLFAITALIFRSIDLPMCATFPLGTHFLWHLFLSIAALLIILMFIVIDYTRRFSTLPSPFPHYTSLRPTRRGSPQPPRPTLHV